MIKHLKICGCVFIALLAGLCLFLVFLVAAILGLLVPSIQQAVFEVIQERFLP